MAVIPITSIKLHPMGTQLELNIHPTPLHFPHYRQKSQQMTTANTLPMLLRLTLRLPSHSHLVCISVPYWYSPITNYTYWQTTDFLILLLKMSREAPRRTVSLIKGTQLRTKLLISLKSDHREALTAYRGRRTTGTLIRIITTIKNWLIKMEARVTL